MLDVVILAAGKGTRMNSRSPKVLQNVAGRPMLEHVLLTAQRLDPRALHVVIGHGSVAVRERLGHYPVNWVFQTEQLGTGHAVKQAAAHWDQDGVVLVLYGDVPLVCESTIKKLTTQVVENRNMALLTACPANPDGYGRIVRDAVGQVTGIVEQKDAADAELNIREVNTGIMAVAARDLGRWVSLLSNNNSQGEYYLTDIVSMASAEGVVINTVSVEHDYEMLGVNTRQQQAEIERIFQKKSAETMMQNGVILADPDRFDCRGTVKTGRDVFIDANVLFEGCVELGDGVTIEPNCIIKDAIIGSDCLIRSHSVIDGAQLGEGVSIGPFARIRPGTVLGKGSRIGNFVETKKAVIGENSKVNHLAYIGDALIGDECNVGAGTITCNYDGVNKHKSVMGDAVFIGSNSTLVAPIVIGNGGFVAAGSTVTKDVPAEGLAVARNRQRNIDGWQRPGKDGSSH